MEKQRDKVISYNIYHEYHSYNDKPAVVYNNGIRCWYQYGLLHRKDNPAVIFPNGVALYYDKGELKDMKIVILTNNEENKN